MFYYFAIKKSCGLTKAVQRAGKYFTSKEGMNTIPFIVL